MELEKLVSIILPVYNQELYLDISLPAVLNQSYRNLEIILVNDGSTDASMDIMKNYQKKDSRIKIIEKNNGGLVDATLTGIEHATGEYMCFLDPDDRIGIDFIKNFLVKMDDTIDFVAAGFYYDNAGQLKPFALDEDRVFKGDDLEWLKEHYLLPEKGDGISKAIFVSRWNKLYRSTCVKEVAHDFSRCKAISLGEDTLFTYFMLKKCRGGIAISKPNTYFYNIGNQNSMMKKNAVSDYLEKCDTAFYLFLEVLKEDKTSTKQAYALFYYLSNSIFLRLYKQDRDEFGNLYRKLHQRKYYKKAIDVIKSSSISKKEKVMLEIRKKISSPYIYIKINEGFGSVKKRLKINIEMTQFVIKSIPRKGVIKTIYECRFRHNRIDAFKDLKEQLPLLEERIHPFICEFEKKHTDFSKCPIEKNIFVFWWTGFENAPEIVKECYRSLERNYSDCRIIQITKDTFRAYTDIHQTILEDFKKGKISVQTFSDILRFNLLKNNGGMWVDATIFFSKKYDLFSGLEQEPFTSMAFSTSKNFIQYKGVFCSWSGYFIASRKNSVLVNAADYIFEQYYLKYHTYSIYFFIDAVFVLLKLYHIDNDVLYRTLYNPGNMFLLASQLNLKYDSQLASQMDSIPQKLNWNFKPNGDKDSFFEQYVRND